MIKFSSTERSRLAPVANWGNRMQRVARERSLKGLGVGVVILGLAWVLGSASALAGPALSGSTDTSTIGGTALQNAFGSLQVNIGAGSGNAQANVSIVGGGEMSQPQHHIVRQEVRGRQSAEINTSAAISGSALSNAIGHIAINQVSGDSNAEANVASIAFGSPIGPAQLGAVVPKQHSSVSGPIPYGTNEVSISGQALSATSGLVQVAQVGGSGNTAANTFALRMGKD